MTTLATLGPSVRLIIFQFLMKSAQVPAIIPPKRVSEAPPLPPVSGVEVLKSTSGLNVFPLASKIASSERYELVDVWKKPYERNWNMSFVRFVFCRKEHVKRNELYPGFVAKENELEMVLINLASKNLWATQGHLHPYFENGNPSGHQVLLIGCAGRIPNTEVFSGGRDENNRGVGPKVLLSILSHWLDLKTGEVVLEVSEPLPVPIPAI